MKIGELAKVTGTKAETIRYYEKIGLLRAPERTGSNYRDYGPEDKERLAFIRHARGLGFEIADIRSLIALAEDPGQDCGQADRIANAHLKAVETKIGQLGQLQAELQRMISQCRGGHISECHIIQSLSDHELCQTDHP